MSQREKGVDHKTRLRIAAYLRRAQHDYELANPGAADAHFAKVLGIDPGTVSKILSGEASAGLDVGLALVRRRHIPAEDVFNHDPELKWFTPRPKKRSRARKPRILKPNGSSGMPLRPVSDSEG